MNILKFKKEILFRGKKFTVYSIGWFAFLVHRTPWTIRNWQRLGILPEPILSLSNDKTRWYLPDEMLGYSKIYRDCDVRAGKNIQESGFKHRAHTFKADLTRKLEKHLEEVATRIPNDDAVGKAMLDKQEIRFNKEIENILEAGLNDEIKKTTKRKR